MIPKIIHYCWFGGKPLDEKSKKCIESWKKYFPDYEIIQWNESNFNVNEIEFMKKAYDNQKWAFVSDVARLLIIYEYGGFYFDTDVEIIKSFNDIIDDGFEGYFGLEHDLLPNSGLGFGAIKHQKVIKELIDVYKNLDYDRYSEELGKVACPIVTGDLLRKKGFKNKNQIQFISDIKIFTCDYFDPINYQNGKVSLTNNTHSIHWYNASWQELNEKIEQEKLRKLNSIFGIKLGEKIYGISYCIKKEGFINYILNRLK